MKYLPLFFCFCLPGLAFYSLTGFTFWEWNPRNWSEGARLLVALISLLFGGTILGYCLETWDD